MIESDLMPEIPDSKMPDRERDTGSRRTTLAGDPLTPSAPKPETPLPPKEPSLGPTRSLDPTGVGAGVNLCGTHLSLVTVNVHGLFGSVGDLFVDTVKEFVNVAIQKYRDWFGKSAA